MPLDVVETLSELVRIPSVNPMGQPVAGPEYFEGRVTDYLQRLFGQLGLPCERAVVHEGRENIIARLDAPHAQGDEGPLLLFEAHQDTVPVEGMTIEPWSGERREGRLWGRGSCDIKGGMAAMLTALSHLASEDREPGAPTLVMACTVNEEFGYTGATSLVQLWESGESKLLPRRPDAVIVAEPTTLDVVVAHKGVCRWKCHTRGTAAHSSQPHTGENAIFKMAAVLECLQEYQSSVAPEQGVHPLVGRPTLSVGVIAGGISVNTVPAQCEIQIDRRLLPGESPEQAQRHVIDYLADRLGDGACEHDPPFLSALGLANENNGELAQRLAGVAAHLGEESEIVGVQYGTDAAAYSAAGAPSVVFGPGHIDQAHTKDEWVEIDQLKRAAKVLYEFGRRKW